MRYVFYNSAGLSPKAISAAKRAATAHDATVLRSAPGQLLVQAEPANAAAIARALPAGWQYSIEQNLTSLPEPISLIPDTCVKAMVLRHGQVRGAVAACSSVR